MRRLWTSIAMLIVVAFLGAAVVDEQADRGVHLRTLQGTRVELELDDGLTIDDALDLVTMSDRAAARVEAVFDAHFTTRPRIAIFTSPESFARGVTALFGYSPDAASAIAYAYGGLFDRRTTRIAIDRDTALHGAGAGIEHELVHQMTRELAGSAELPTWLEEGLATAVTQDDLPSGEWLEEEELVGRAVAASGLVSFSDTSTLEGWHQAYSRIGEPLYDYAAEAVRWMEFRIGWSGVVGAIMTARDHSFETAYRRAAGETLTSVEARLDTSSTTAIVVRARPDHDEDVLWTLFTGIPDAETTVTISGGRSYEVSFTVTTDQLGMYRGTFGSTAQRGVYVVRAAGVEAVLDTDH